MCSGSELGALHLDATGEEPPTWVGTAADAWTAAGIPQRPRVGPPLRIGPSSLLFRHTRLTNDVLIAFKKSCAGGDPCG